MNIDIPLEAIVITDCPYNIGKPQLIGGFMDKKTGKSKMGHGMRTIGHDFGEDFDTAALLPSHWAPKMPNTVITFYGAKRMAHLIRAFHRVGFEIVQDFHWCKYNAPPPLRAIGFAWATESGYVFRRKGTKHTVNKEAGYSPNFFGCPATHVIERGNALHTTQKPVRVMKWLTYFLSTKDSLIVDPFMGSGSVGVACAELGRRFIGIEQDEEYCTTAVNRIKKALNKFRNGLGFC